jgi:hypothetical protein
MEGDGTAIRSSQTATTNSLVIHRQRSNRDMPSQEPYTQAANSYDSRDETPAGMTLHNLGQMWPNDVADGDYSLEEQHQRLQLVMEQQWCYIRTLQNDCARLRQELDKQSAKMIPDMCL